MTAFPLFFAPFSGHGGSFGQIGALEPCDFLNLPGGMENGAQTGIKQGKDVSPLCVVQTRKDMGGILHLPERAPVALAPHEIFEDGATNIAACAKTAELLLKRDGNCTKIMQKQVFKALPHGRLHCAGLSFFPGGRWIASAFLRLFRVHF